VPVVSAVGHEIDFSIADFVADLRAPTPSAAAELLVPDARAQQRHLDQLRQRVVAMQERRLQARIQRIDHLLTRLQAQRPQARLTRDRERLLQLHRRLLGARVAQLNQRQARLDRMHAHLLARHPRHALALLRHRLEQQAMHLRRMMEHKLERERLTLQQTARALHTVSPLATLERGYAILFDTEGRVLRSVQQVAVDTPLHAKLADGELALRVTEK
jgi:exodeoxyribonuclease VII large subunit